MGVSSREERKSRTGDEIGGVRGTVNGVCLGGIGIRGDDDATSSESATSLVGSAGAGFTWSAQGVGVGIGVFVDVVVDVGGSRGVVAVEVLPSMHTGFTARGEGTYEFICPLASKRGGTDIQSFSFSFGVIIG